MVRFLNQRAEDDRRDADTTGDYQVGASSASTGPRRVRPEKRKAELQGFPPDKPAPFRDRDGDDSERRTAFTAFIDERIEIPTRLKGNQLNYNKCDATTQRGLDASRKVK